MFMVLNCFSPNLKVMLIACMVLKLQCICKYFQIFWMVNLKKLLLHMATKDDSTSENYDENTRHEKARKFLLKTKSNLRRM